MELKEGTGNPLEGLKALASGFATVLKHLFRRPVTEEYPEFKRKLPPRSRARIILTRDPDGDERCVACYLCSAVCPVVASPCSRRNGKTGAAMLDGSGSTLPGVFSAGFVRRRVPLWPFN